MVRKESWFREVLGFKATPKRPDQTWEEWHEEQEQGYREWAGRMGIPVEEEPSDADREVKRVKNRIFRERNPNYLKVHREENPEMYQKYRQEEWDRHLLRMEIDPEYAAKHRAMMEKARKKHQEKNPGADAAAKRRWKEEHKRKLREDPAYAEAYRAKQRARMRLLRDRTRRWRDSKEESGS